jgi:DNA-binding transcriptional ArsR family regulator
MTLDLDRDIHEPARLAIVAMLYAAAEADFLFLQRETGLTKGNLSSHLTRLEQAG